MMSKAKFQYYRHNYGLVCMTGMLGCRWHRYKQSTRDNRKRDFLVFVVIFLAFLYMVLIFYCVLVVKNDFDDINWFMYSILKKWIPWYTLLLAVISILFSYFIIIMLLALGHILHGHQLYIHPVHTIIAVVVFAILVFLTWMMIDQNEGSLLLLSLKMMGPFLQIGAVIFMTGLTWVISRQWFTLLQTGTRLLWLFIYLTVMICLYISPVFINSPCIVTIEQLPDKPQVFAHKGASGIAPENTLASFHTANKYSVLGFETDVRISADGIAFLMHDRTLERTTNVADVFPELAGHDAAYFNISQIKQLNAGRWFIETDPMGSVSDLTEEQTASFSNQTIPTLLDVAILANKTGMLLMFDLHRPPVSHTHHDTYINITVDVLRLSGIPLHKVWWLEKNDNKHLPAELTLVWDEVYTPVASLRSENISTVNLAYSAISQDEIKEYRSANITTNIFLVNTVWFFSVYWCMGVTSVTSNMCHILFSVQDPVWHMSPQSYLILWVTVDVLSAVFVVALFIIQRVHLYGAKFTPETMSLNTAHNGQQSSVSKQAMKERLLMKDVTTDTVELEPGNRDVGIESQYTVGSMDGRIMSNRYHSYSDRMQTEAHVEFQQ